MKKYNDLKIDEQKAIRAYFATWLTPYTHEVIIHVMKQVDEIINNDMSMMMLKELHERKQVEAVDFERSIGNMLESFDNTKYDPHNHCLTHAGSYRDILYDLYIADRKDR